MTVTDKIDLQAEHEKCTALLALIEDARAKEKAHKDGEQCLLDTRKYIATLNIKLKADENELDKLRISHDSEVKDHVIKRTKWQEKNVRMERIAFRGGDDWSSDSGEESDLEERAELMQENLNLLLQRNAIKKLATQMKHKQASINQASLDISAKESLVSTLEPNARVFALALEKLALSLRSGELSCVKDTTKSHATEIASLTKSNVLHTKKIKQLNTEIEDLKSVNRQQQKLIAPLLAQVRLLEDFHEDKSKTIAENMKAAYEEGRKFQYREMAGPYGAGCAIRGRKLVWICSETDDLIIGLGNKASHYGMALADAALYQESCPAPYRRTKTAGYIKLYGVSPDFVWKHQSIQKLLDILDWRGAMKDFCAHSYSPYYEGTAFHSLSYKLIVSINRASITTEEVAKLLEMPNSIKSYNELKGFFEEGLKKHNIHLENRRQ